MNTSTNTTTIQVTAAEAETLRAILAAVSPAEVATTPKVAKTKGKAAKKARKTATRKAAGTTIVGKTCLTSKNRKQFIADHGAKQGLSTRELVQAVAAGEIVLTGNWAIGPRYAAKFGVTTAPAKKVKAVKAVKAAPATKAQVFRRANGTVAPKGEWAIRAVLEAQGLSRAEVDEKTAAALAVLA